MNNATQAFSFLAVATFLTASLSAQSITGDLAVKVTDPTGAVIAGARLELTAVDTNVKQEAQTDALGNVLFSQLKPGSYRLEVSVADFQKASITDSHITYRQRAWNVR